MKKMLLICSFEKKKKKMPRMGRDRRSKKYGTGRRPKRVNITLLDISEDVS